MSLNVESAPMTAKIRILLVDDHAIVRAGLKMLLTEQKDMQVTAEAERGEDALTWLSRQSFDVMILDLSMPGIGGLETLRRAIQRCPALKVLILSVHDEAVYQQQARTAGAQGFLGKASPPERMVEVVRQLAAGQSCWPKPKQAAASDLIAVAESFSAREFDVFCLLAKGFTVAKAANELCLGYKTVANYGTRIRSKLNAANAAELAHIARALGIVAG